VLRPRLGQTILTHTPPPIPSIEMSTVTDPRVTAPEPSADLAEKTGQGQSGQPCDPEGEDLMNAATFSPPSLAVGPNVYIEYCDRVSF
jgi:hypothetical protein